MRRLPIGLLATALVLALAAPVGAVKPVRGCPNPAFVAMSYPQFRALSLSVGVPEELLGPEHEAGWATFDKNSDGVLCVKDQPDTPGTFFGWIFNVVDNTANR